MSAGSNEMSAPTTTSTRPQRREPPARRSGPLRRDHLPVERLHAHRRVRRRAARAARAARGSHAVEAEVVLHERQHRLRVVREHDLRRKNAPSPYEASWRPAARGAGSAGVCEAHLGGRRRHPREDDAREPVPGAELQHAPPCELLRLPRDQIAEEEARLPEGRPGPPRCLGTEPGAQLERHICVRHGCR
jgi:hypothetical protein